MSGHINQPLTEDNFTLLQFKKFVEEHPNSDFTQNFVLSLVNEVIRLRVKCGEMEEWYVSNAHVTHNSTGAEL